MKKRELVVWLVFVFCPSLRKIKIYYDMNMSNLNMNLMRTIGCEYELQKENNQILIWFPLLLRCIFHPTSIGYELNTNQIQIQSFIFKFDFMPKSVGFSKNIHNPIVCIHFYNEACNILLHTHVSCMVCLRPSKQSI